MGESHLEYAKRSHSVDEKDAQAARLASAHFAASMAITNVLLTDPVEHAETVPQ